MAYFKYYFTSNRHKLLLGAIVVFAVATILIVLLNLISANYIMTDYQRHPYRQVDPFWGFEMFLMYFLTLLFLSISGSMMFGSLSDKRQRLDVIELPASQSEKFLTWWLIYLPLTFVVLMVSFWLADLLRVGLLKLFTPYWGWFHPMPIKSILTFNLVDHTNPRDVDEMTWVFYGIALFSNAFFALGSILFHKLSFIKTMVSYFVLSFLIMIFTMVGSSMVGGTGYGRFDSRFDLSWNEEVVIGGCIMLFISMLIYVYCYARYREEEIINRW